MKNTNKVEHLSDKLWDDLGLALAGLGLIGAAMLLFGFSALGSTEPNLQGLRIFLWTTSGLSFVAGVWAMIPWFITYERLARAKEARK